MASYLLSKESFQSLLAKHGLSRLDKLLLILFFDEEKPKSATSIKEIASVNGLKECKKWNISDTLRKSKGKATSINEGWIITTSGRDYLISKGFISEKISSLKIDVADFLTLLPSVKNATTKDFIQEAIKCIEYGLDRAAVVLSWAGAMSLLYDHVVNNHLANFNAEALKRDLKWKPAKNTDDLSRMKEYDFLNILEAISIIGKSVKNQLQQGLQLRNGCAHPNSLKIRNRTVLAHIEMLLLNVYSKF